jgi:hypothetical protein
MALKLTETQFAALVGETNQNLSLREETVKGGKNGKEVTVRLVLVERGNMRIGTWALCAWVVLAALSGSLATIPIALLWLVTVYNMNKARVTLDELLSGLQAAGVIESDTGQPHPPSEAAAAPSARAGGH